MVTVPRDAPAWARALADDVTAHFDRMAARGFPVRMPSYPKADLPSAAAYPNTWIYVADDVGGATPAFSDGVVWRRTSDRAVIA